MLLRYTGSGGQARPVPCINWPAAVSTSQLIVAQNRGILQAGIWVWTKTGRRVGKDRVPQSHVSRHQRQSYVESPTTPTRPPSRGRCNAVRMSEVEIRSQDRVSGIEVFTCLNVSLNL